MNHGNTKLDVTPFRAQYPWEGRFLDVGGGVRMHYLDEGAGEPLVMLHGNPTWSFHYRHLVRAFAGTHRVVVPDHVGCGLSDKPGDDRYEYVLERRVRDLGLLLDRLELEDVTLVAHDWGGMIGLAWALRHLERVSRLALFNTAGFGLPAGRELPWQIAVVRRLPGFEVPVRGFNAFVRGALAGCTKRPGAIDDLARRAYLAPYDSWKNRIAVQRFVDDIPLQRGDRSFPIVDEVSRNLDRITDRPVFIGWGARDFVFDDAFLDEWRRRVPRAEIHRFADAGHFVLEDARDELLPLLRSFLARHPVGAAAAGKAAPSAANPSPTTAAGPASDEGAGSASPSGTTGARRS
ncbi:MAG TPA: alpha/beta fold hydrolase [Vulgatibacter sp.]